MTGPSGPPLSQNHTHQQSSGQLRPELRYLAIGRIVKPHGIRGELSVIVLTDFPERFDNLEWVFVGDEFQADPYRLIQYRWHKQHVLLTLEGVADRDKAEQLAGQLVQIPIEDAVMLPEGDYYLYQLIGLDVYTASGECIGKIEEIIETGANDVYVVRDSARKSEILIPAIPDVIKSVDLDQQQLLIELMDGLI
jgi:16S rRNA processing protein RimM